MVSLETLLYLLVIAIGLGIGNLYGIRRIFILEARIVALEEAIAKLLAKQGIKHEVKPRRKLLRRKRR